MFFNLPVSLRVIRNLLSKCAENQAIRFWELVGSFFCALVVISSLQACAESSQGAENLLDTEFKVEALEDGLLVEQEMDKSELASLYLETENAEEYLESGGSGFSEADARIIEVIGTACGSAGGRGGCEVDNVGGYMCAYTCNNPPSRQEPDITEESAEK